MTYNSNTEHLPAPNSQEAFIMRRTIIFSMGVLELIVAVLLVFFGREIPGNGLVGGSFQSAERVTDRAGIQVRLLRDQVQTLRSMELRQLSARLQKQTEAIGNTLRTQTVDFDTVSIMRDAVGDLAKGLGELAETLDPASIAKLSHGLGDTAEFLEHKGMTAPPQAAGRVDQSTSPNSDRIEQTKYQGKIDVPIKDKVAPATPVISQPPKAAIELARALPEADRLKEIAKALRRAQNGLEATQARWPELRSTLKQLANVLKATHSQLDQAVEHRQDYEEALEQTMQLADTFSFMLPLMTNQLDGRLDEEEHTLTDLGHSLDDIGNTLPGYAQTTSRLLWTARLLAWLVAAIVGLHGCYLTISSCLIRSQSFDRVVRKSAFRSNLTAQPSLYSVACEATSMEPRAEAG